MDDLERFEKLRQRVVAGVQAYEAKMASDLALYRSQRAWRLMLAARKAYSLARGGWRGRFRALAWAAGALCGRPAQLDTADLTFPDVSEFLPDDLFYPSAHASLELARSAPDRRYDVLIFPVFEYDFRYQRPQQIAAEFARRGHRVFWISPMRTAGPGAHPYQVVPVRHNVCEIRLHMPPQDIYGGVLSPADLQAMLDGLTTFYRELAITSAVSLVQFPYWRGCALALRERFGTSVVYDCMDDWRNWTAEPAIGPFALAEESKLSDECDLLLVSSREFEHRQRSEGRSPVLVRNATDFAFFAAGRSAGLLAGTPRPVVGYYGAIADWFDLDLVEKVARLRPQYSFVLIGQGYRADLHRLKRLPNVHLLGEKHYRSLPAYLSDFDVCLIPFTSCLLTRGVDPVKAYEYLSQGKPVVSTPLPELTESRGLIYFAGRPAEFAASIDAALSEQDPGLREQRIRLASQNTWSHRVDAIAESIQGLYPLVSILILTYNSREYLRPCLDAILSQTAYPNYEVVIVDNHSFDGTPEVAERYAAADPRVHVHLLEENRGFAGGNNEAARLSRGEFLLLLNPDTIVTSGWLHRLMRVFQRHPAAGIAAPVSNYSGNETKISFDYTDLKTMHRFAAELAARRGGEYSEAAVAPLFCGLVPRRLWLSLGGLDERYQVGMFEDDDFSLRVRRAGYRIVVAEDCLVHHFGGGSFAKLATEESLRVFHQNRKQFEEKWGMPWTPHRLRPGVKSPHEDRRFTPAEFVKEPGVSSLCHS